MSFPHGSRTSLCPKCLTYTRLDVEEYAKEMIEKELYEKELYELEEISLEISFNSDILISDITKCHP